MEVARREREACSTFTPKLIVCWRNYFAIGIMLAILFFVVQRSRCNSYWLPSFIDTWKVSQIVVEVGIQVLLTDCRVGNIWCWRRQTHHSTCFAMYRVEMYPELWRFDFFKFVVSEEVCTKIQLIVQHYGKVSAHTRFLPLKFAVLQVPSSFGIQQGVQSNLEETQPHPQSENRQEPVSDSLFLRIFFNFCRIFSSNFTMEHNI